MLHDLIIWPNAVQFKDTIIDDLKSSFSLVTSITIRWDDDKWYDNLKVFYSQSWKRFSFSKLQKAIMYKTNHCGRGDFVLVVFEDPTSEMLSENTTDGKCLVNSRVFNKKKEYRRLTGGGHLIHTSNNSFETDRDLTLLLGLDSNDFLKQFPHCNADGISISRNCTGVDGYDSLSSLFYTLTHSIDYCVLRNFECLPDHYFQQGHDDIDLLVDNLHHMVNLTLAKPISGSENRVDYSIRIGGEDIAFDFRFVGDDYYDPDWEKCILDNRVLEKNLFYIPGPADCYYSLLYHAYIQKNQVKPDYHIKLDRLGLVPGVSYFPDIQSSVLQLDAYLKEHGYEYIRPKDKTVVFNSHNLGYSEYAFRNGSCIKHTEERGRNGFIYSSKVFENGSVINKLGTSWLMENEASFLDRLCSYDCFPKVVSKQLLGNGQTCLKLTRIEGRGGDSFFKDVSHQHPCFLRSFLLQIVSILIILKNNGINHRDINPSNLIVRRDKQKVRVGLIDFGWAIDINNKESKTPAFLGGRYSNGDGHSDAYAIGVFLMDYWADLPCVRWLASVLFKAAENPTSSLLKKAEKIARLPIGPYERFRLFLRRHQRVSMIWRALIK